MRQNIICLVIIRAWTPQLILALFPSLFSDQPLNPIFSLFSLSFLLPVAQFTHLALSIPQQLWLEIVLNMVE